MSYEYFSQAPPTNQLVETIRGVLTSDARYEVVEFSEKLVRLRYTDRPDAQWGENALIFLGPANVCVQLHSGETPDGAALLSSINEILSRFGAPPLAEED